MPAPGVTFLPQGRRRGPPILVRQAWQAPPQPFTALTENFSSALDAGKWTQFASPVVTSGQLQIVPVSAYDDITTTDRYTLVGNSVSCQFVQAPNASALNTTMEMHVGSSTDAVYVLWYQSTLIFRERVASSNSDTSIAYVPATHRYVRVSESGGTINWDTSVDGTTWTNRRTKVSTLDLSHAQLRLTAGTFAGDVGTGTAIFDNINLVGETLLDAAATATGTGTAAIDVVKTLQAAGTATGTGTTTITKTSTLAAAATATGTGTTTITITHTLDAASTATGTGTAAIAKTSTLQVAGTATGTGTAAVTKTSTLAAAATATGAGTAAVDKTTVLDAASTATGTGTTTIAKVTVLDAADVATATGTTTVAKTSTLQAAGVATGTGTANVGNDLLAGATATAHGTAVITVLRDTDLTPEAEPGTTRGDGLTVPPLSQFYNVNRFGRTYLNRRNK